MSGIKIFTVDDLSNVSDDLLTDMIVDAHKRCERQMKDAVASAINTGAALTVAKSRAIHGSWMKFLDACGITHQTARTYMTLASNSKRFEFEKAGSIREAMRMIADESSSEKREHKASVKVVDPADRPVETSTSKQPDELPQLPKTNTKHTAENRKANPAEQPATRPVNVQAELVECVGGDEPLSKAEQFEIAPELIEAVEKTRDGRHLIDVLGEEDPQQLIESCFKHNAVTAIVRFLINSTKDKDVEDVAKQLRKAADLLDPIKKPAKAGSVPSAADLIEAISPDWPDDLFEATKQWATYKQGRAKGERIQSMSAWEIARKQIWSKAEANGVDSVVTKIEKAIANSWKGWDHGDKDDAKKTATGRTGRIKPTSAVPPIEYR